MVLLNKIYDKNSLVYDNIKSMMGIDNKEVIEAKKRKNIVFY